MLVADIVDANADTNHSDRSGHAALHLAIAQASPTGTTMALRLVRGPKTDVNLRSGTGRPPLLMAVQTMNLKVVKALLAKSADPNAMSKPEKVAPLHTAISQVRDVCMQDR